MYHTEHVVADWHEMETIQVEAVRNWVVVAFEVVDLC